MSVKTAWVWFLHKIHRFFRPVDEDLFEYFIRLAVKGEEIAGLLCEMLANPDAALAAYKKMFAIEKQADAIKAAGHSYIRTEASFPIPDEEQSHDLLGKLDNVVDDIDSVGRRIMLIARFNGKIFNVHNTFYEHMIQQASVLFEIVRLQKLAVGHLARLELNPMIHRQSTLLENRGDRLWEGKKGVLDAYFSFLGENVDKPLLAGDLLMVEWKLMSHAIEHGIDETKRNIECIYNLTDEHKDLELSLDIETVRADAVQPQIADLILTEIGD